MKRNRLNIADINAWMQSHKHARLAHSTTKEKMFRCQIVASNTYNRMNEKESIGIDLLVN